MKKFDSNILNSALQIGVNDSSSMGVYRETRLQHWYLDLLYENSAIMSRIIDAIPFFSTKEMVDIKTGDENLDSQIEKYIIDNNILNLIQQTCIQARIHGGSALWLFNAGSNLKSGNFTSIIQLDIREISRNSSEIESNPVSSNFGNPTSYSITPSETSTSYPVTAERLVKINGISVPRNRLSYYNYFGKSYLEKLYNGLMLLEQSYSQVAHILSDFNKDVLKSEVINQLSSNAESFYKRLQLLSTTKNNKGIVAIDKEMEEYEQLSKTTSGIDKLLNHLENYIVLATGIPKIVIFGEGTGGLNSNSVTEMKHFYDLVRKYQKETVEPALRQIIRMKYNIEDFNIDFKPIDKPTQKELVDLQLKSSRMDKIYVDLGVYTPEIVTRERFLQSEYSTDVNVSPEDIEEIKKMNEERKKELKNNNKQPIRK